MHPSTLMLSLLLATITSMPTMASCENKTAAYRVGAASNERCLALPDPSREPAIIRLFALWHRRNCLRLWSDFLGSNAVSPCSDTAPSGGASNSIGYFWPISTVAQSNVCRRCCHVAWHSAMCRVSADVDSADWVLCFDVASFHSQ